MVGPDTSEMQQTPPEFYVHSLHRSNRHSARPRSPADRDQGRGWDFQRRPNRHLEGGGFGSAVLECLSDAGLTGVAIKRIGVPDVFIEHGPQDFLRSKFGLDALSIVNTVKELCIAPPLDIHSSEWLHQKNGLI